MVDLPALAELLCLVKSRAAEAFDAFLVLDFWICFVVRLLLRIIGASGADALLESRLAVEPLKKPSPKVGFFPRVSLNVICDLLEHLRDSNV